jgi:23S rRNA pseudouridine1911/1915/1917 synthase
VVETFQWTVTAEDDGLRLDAFLARHLSMFSRRERAALIASRHVQVNGRSAAKGDFLRSHDQVKARVATELIPSPSLPVGVLYADASIVVINKPAGIASVALRHTDTQTVANFLTAHFPDTGTASSRQLEAGLVHRLDTDTSGILVAARTPEAYTVLRKQFRQRLVGKDYLALVEGQLTAAGCIVLPLAPTEHHRPRMRVVAPGHGQEAITEYTPVEHFTRHTLVRLSIKTGVRHQIRAHLAALNHPIVGDRLYGVADALAPRLCLHAETLTFRHPLTGESVSYTSIMPEDFSTVLEQLRYPTTYRREHVQKKEQKIS